MLRQVAEDVWTHESEFLQSQTIVVQGKNGVLLIDPGITIEEMAGLTDDLRELGRPVVLGFSTHPHWDHVLWHAKFGEVPRYGTAANAAEMQEVLSNTGWKEQVTPMLPPDIGDQIPLDGLFGRITGLPAGTTHIPWDGPRIRIIEHQAHASGHVALLIEEPGVLVAGDMLSDTLIPFLDLEAKHPVGDYLAALQLLEDVTRDVKVIITGHGSIGDTDQMRKRIELDRTYVKALRNRDKSNDPRLTVGPNKDWLPGVHTWQVEQLSKNRDV